MDLSKYGQPISEEEIKKPTEEINFVFIDSQFLPLKCFFVGNIKRKSQNGLEVPYRCFVMDLDEKTNDRVFLLSIWNKGVNIPLELTEKCPVQIYVNEDKKLEVLKLD